MNNRPPPLPLVQYLYFIDNGDPERMSPPDLLEMAGAVKHHLASIQSTTPRAVARQPGRAVPRRTHRGAARVSARREVQV